MDRQGIFAGIGRVIAESAQAGVEWATATEETPIAAFGFDSLAILDLLFDLEGEFGVEISAEEILNIGTIGELITFLDGRMNS